MTTTGKHAREGGGKLRKRHMAIAAAAMCLALTGGTLAYFTAEERAHNVITSGGVDIELLEWADLQHQDEWTDIEGVMPGTSVTKAVEVANTGASPAWVRVKVTKAIEMADEGDAPDLDLIQMDFDEESWTLRDGWWYYTQPLPAEKADDPNAHVTPYLFTKVTFAGAGMGNPYQNAKITIDVQAEAVQVANNGDSALTASGWPTK